MSEVDEKIKEEILLDPYASIDDDEKGRLNADVPNKVKLRIQAVCPHRGVLQAIVNLFIQSVAQEMEERGIVFYEPEQYEQFINIIRRRTARWPDKQGPSSVGQPPTGGTSKEAPRASERPANVAPVTSDAASKTGKRSATKKTKTGEAC